MDYMQHGAPGAEGADYEMTGYGCACSAHPGPTPSPFPPSPTMPGPSVQSGGRGGSPGSAPGVSGPTHGVSHQGFSGHTGSPPGSHQSGGGAGGHADPGTARSAHMHHPPLHEAYHYGYYPHGAPPQYPVPSSEGYTVFGLNLSDGNFWKGALIGAGLALLITNETVQRSIMMVVAKAYSAAQEGVGEIKEMFEDAQAELRKPGE